MGIEGVPFRAEMYTGASEAPVHDQRMSSPEENAIRGGHGIGCGGCTGAPPRGAQRNFNGK